MQNKSNKGLKRGPTVKNDERLKILMEMDEPDYSPEIVEGLTGTTNGLSDVWEELLAETAEHYKEYGLGNTYEYNVVANAIFNIYPNIAAIKPSSSLAEPSSRHNKPQKSSTSSNKNQSLKKGRPSWWYFSKCLSDLNRKERRKKRNCSIATLTSDGRFDLSGQHNLEKVVPERKRRQGPGEVDFSKISEVMGEITKLYSAQVKDYPTLSRLIKETFSHRSKLIAGGSVAAMLLYKNYKALKDLTLFQVEAEELYTPEQIRCMHQNVTAFKQAIMLVNPGKTEKDAFEDYFLVMRPKEVFLTIYETKEDYDSFLRPSSKATPRLKALISNESTAITLFIGDFELNESDSLTEGLLNLVLAVHLFRKENPVDLGNAFVALESFALGIDARDFTASQENYYQAMLNTLPSRTEY